MLTKASSLILVGTLLVLVHRAHALTLTCGTAGVTITVNDADGFNDQFVQIANQDSCTQIKQLTGTGGTQSAFLDCYSFTLGTAYTVVILASNSIATEEDDIATIQATCVAQTSATVTDFLTVTAPTPTASITDILNADVQMTVSPATTSLGQTVTVTIELGVSFQSFYVIGVETLNVASPTASVDIITVGCPITTPIIVTTAGTPSNSPATTIVTTYPSFLPYGDGGAFTLATTLTLTATVTLCEVGGDTSGCFQASACSGADLVGRKKRQTSVTAQDTILTGQVEVFVTEEDRQEYIETILQQEGIKRSGATPEDDLCVNKTISGVIVSFLVLGMILCLLALCWMFMKLRRSRKRRDKTSDTSVFTESNRAFR